MKVYVSGPYTKGDPCENTHRAIMAGNAIFDAGHVPFVPHVFHFWHTVTPRPYEDWMAVDLAFLPACDVVLRLPGESGGAEREVAEAQRLGIPVSYDLGALLADLELQRLASHDDAADCSEAQMTTEPDATLLAKRMTLERFPGYFNDETFGAARKAQFIADDEQATSLLMRSNIQGYFRGVLDALRQSRRARVRAPIEDAFALSRALVTLNALHVKRQIRVAEQPLADVIEHMREEVGELSDAPDDLAELADIVALCASYAARQGWSTSTLGHAMVDKMRARFEAPAVRHALARIAG